MEFQIYKGLSIAMAVYMLGFNTYNGFKDYLKDETCHEDTMLKCLYEFAKKWYEMESDG